MKFITNKIQIDILKRHLGPFIFCFFTVMFLLLMQFLILHIDRLIGKGLPIGVIVELILTNLAFMVVLAAPMAVLVASLMAYGKFTELNELTALRAAGINPVHSITPLLVAAGLTSIFLFWFSDNVLPDANQRARSLFLDIRTKKPGFDLQEGEFYDGIEGYTFLVKNIPSDSDSLYDVTLFQEASGDRNKAIIKAQKGYLASQNEQTLNLYLYNGSIIRTLYRRHEGQSTEIKEKTAFNRYRLSFDLSEMAFSRSNPDDHSRNDRTMDIKAMMAVVDTLKMEIQSEKDKVIKKYNFSQLPDDINQNRNRIPLKYNKSQNADSLQKSRFMALQNAPSKAYQKTIHRQALNKLRNYRSAYENLQVNTDWRTQRIAKYWVEIYKKFSLPLACLIFVLVGAPIGMKVKKGNLGYAALIGTGFLTFFWISIIQGEKLADRMFISPFTGMWFSDILLAIIGSIMIIQLTTSFKISNIWKTRD